jgi:hypothetical protein
MEVPERIKKYGNGKAKREVKKQEVFMEEEMKDEKTTKKFKKEKRYQI